MTGSRHAKSDHDGGNLLVFTTTSRLTVIRHCKLIELPVRQVVTEKVIYRLSWECSWRNSRS